MLETYAALLTEISRNLARNIRENPFLYYWFGCMLMFSVMMMAMLTTFMIMNEVTVDVGDLVTTMFFLFLFKSAADFHKYFSTSSALSYAFSTQVSHRRTVFEVFTTVFWVNLGLFVFLSSVYMVFLGLAGIYLAYPQEYVQVVLAVVLGIILGAVVTLHFFSPRRVRLLPAGVMIALVWLFHGTPSLLVLVGCAMVYLVWSLGFALDSYQYVSRKKRQEEQLQLRVHETRMAIFYKEIITLWREKLLMSFVFTAAVVGGFTGYLTVFGEDLLIPKNLQVISQSFLPGAYGVLGIYIVVIYTAVFPAMNMFFMEENTVWILRHLPVRERIVVQGKAFALSLTLFCCVPFLAFYAAFTGGENLVFFVWFLVFSFLAGVIVSLPLGVKYLGRKSDILVLYCVALIVFVVLGVAVGVEGVMRRSPMFLLLFYVVSIGVELGLLMGSVELSSHLLSLKHGVQG